MANYTVYRREVYPEKLSNRVFKVRVYKWTWTYRIISIEEADIVSFFYRIIVRVYNSLQNYHRGAICHPQWQSHFKSAACLHIKGANGVLVPSTLDLLHDVLYSGLFSVGYVLFFYFLKRSQRGGYMVPYTCNASIRYYLSRLLGSSLVLIHWK